MQRRQFIFALFSTTIVLATRPYEGLASSGNMVTIRQFSDDGKELRRVTLSKVHKDAEWRKTLSPLAYKVTREKGTENAFSIPGYDRHEPGLYCCVYCDSAL